ncbi:Phox-like protein [Phellopilus nigrolimitatus]|nr:Phox-like protein [Phellopilus nigrolimitatus]
MLPTSPLSPADSDFPLTPSSSAFQSAPLASPSLRRNPETRKGREDAYPLAHCAGLVEVLRSDEDRIDVEEEARVYRAFDLDQDDTNALALARTDSRTASRRPQPQPTPQVRGLSHSRAVSSIASRDIWVGESGDAEKHASFARGVCIVGWTSVGDKRGGAYVVYDCALLTVAQTTIHVHKRYSAFAALHAALLRALPAPARAQVPPLPPRAPLARYRVGFLEERRRALQAWLSGVLLHPELGGCGAVREWVMAG